MTAAIILAAGSISHGRQFDPLGDFGGLSPIRRLIAVFGQAGVDRTVVITGHNAERLERHCSRANVIFLKNDEYETSDMLSSVKLGLRYLGDKYERAFIAPVDVPFFTADTLAAMMAGASAQVAVPICGLKTGHPILVSADIFDKVIEYTGTSGLNGLLSSGSITRQFVDVPDNGILFDFSGGEEPGVLISGALAPKIKAEIKVWLSGDQGFFGPGAFRLLTLTGETGSLKTACSHAGLSYSKAWKIMSNIERRLGYPIIESRQGGKRGGTSKITARGHELMRRYEAFLADCNGAVDALFDRHFGDADDLW